MLSRDIASQLRKMAAEKKQNLDIQEVCASPFFLQHIQGLCGEIMKMAGKEATSVQANVISSADSPPGWTDGKQIYLNTINSISGHYTMPFEQFIALRGIFFHECAHILYLDFDEEIKAIKAIKNGELFGNLPVPQNDADDLALTELLSALKKPEYRPIFVQVYSDVSNTIDDPHDEGKMIREFGGIVEQGIVFAREALFRSFDYAEDIAASEGSDLQKLYTFMLEYARFENILMRDQASCLQNEPLIQAIASMAKPIAAARWTDDMDVRFSMLNEIVLRLWPYIKAELDKVEQSQPNHTESGSDGNSQSGDGNSQSGDGNSQGGDGGASSGTQSGTSDSSQNGAKKQEPQNGDSKSNGQESSKKDHSKQAIEQVLNQLQKAAGAHAASPQPKGQESSPLAVKARNAVQNGDQNSAAPKKDSAAASDHEAESEAKTALDSICAKVAEQMAVDELERDITSKLLVEINSADLGPLHQARLVASRNLTVDESDKQLYEEQMADIKGYSKRLQRRMTDVLRDLQEGGIQHHRQIGRIIEANYAYRPDQKFFATKKYPQDWPTIAISVLVDLSGSMRGVRLNAAMRAAMLLYDFATGLGIPVFVAGHNTVSSKVNYEIFTDFDKVGTQDKYRLAHMYTQGSNRDGAAIEASALQLAKRTEDVKLLFVISDGQPNDGAYHGDIAQKDIQSIVSKYRRKGIITFATAIGSDKDRIKAIYGDGFLDITDLSKFPKTLTNIVAKRILRM